MRVHVLDIAGLMAAAIIAIYVMDFVKAML